jgi:hypothetical protein
MFAYRRYRWQSRKQNLSWTMRRRSIREGFIIGNRVWMVVGIVVHGRRLFRKLMDREPKLIATERLVAGQSLSLRAIDPQSEQSA